MAATLPLGTSDTSPGYDEAVDQSFSKISWGAIFAGVVVALVVQVLLTMLGAGIGIATLDPGTGDNPAVSTFSIGAGIWYVLSGIIAAYAGGYIAARMSGKTEPTNGALHGLTTWAFTTLLVLYFDQHGWNSCRRRIQRRCRRNWRRGSNHCGNSCANHRAVQSA